MEQNAIQWLGAPSCLRGSYAFYKSVSSRALSGGPVQVWKLGEFYYVRSGPQEPVCIAEVTLLWEDQTQRHLLASSRLYFLPEDTPKGRTREHGEDEVLAVSKKIVLRVEDLVRWACPEPTVWAGSGHKQPNGSNNVHHTPSNPASVPDKTPEPLKEKTDNGLVEVRGVKVLSYPQYCRFRSLQRRIQDGLGITGLHDPHLLALGGVRVARPDTRVMYCRDTFNHPTIDSNASIWSQLRCPSLSMRGRPRKRRGRDSKDSPTPSQSESWIERMEENVMGSVEINCEGGWLPHPEEQLFLDQLFVFMDHHGSPIRKVPNLGFKKIDLFLMYSVVKRLGGYHKVTNDRLWKVVYNKLGGCAGSTSAATCTRRHYERLMLSYEEHLKAGGAELKVPQSPIVPRTRGMRGRKPLPRGRRPGTKNRDKTASPPSPPPLSPVLSLDGVAVKRGRGRPPGRRNKATLIAQAKLLAQQQAKAKTPQLLPQPPSTKGPARSLQHNIHKPLQKPSPHLQPVYPAISPVNMPLTPDLSPMSVPMLPFQPKPGREMNQEKGEPLTPATSSPGTLLSSLPRFHAGGSLGGFSPTKGMCPLDIFRSRLGLQRGPDSPTLIPQDSAPHPAQNQSSVHSLQPKTGIPDSTHLNGDQPQPHHHSHQCSGCILDEGAQRGGSREGRNRPLLPPLRVLPLDLDCSVKVRQLMRTPLGSTQLQNFTRRLSEVLSQDLNNKPPCSPMTPPPEQALPLNLSKRTAAKRPGSDDLDPRAAAALDRDTAQSSSKRPRVGSPEQCKAEDLSLGGRASRGGPDLDLENQEEPADLSSPSRIRAFLLGLPPFQVRLEEDLSENSWGRPPPSVATPQRVKVEDGGKAVTEVSVKEVIATTQRGQREKGKMERPQPGEEEHATRVETQIIKVEIVDDIKMEVEDGNEEGGENSLTNSTDQNGDFGGQEKPVKEELECDFEASAKELPNPVLPSPPALPPTQQKELPNPVLPSPPALPPTQQKEVPDLVLPTLTMTQQKEQPDPVLLSLPALTPTQQNELPDPVSPSPPALTLTQRKDLHDPVLPSPPALTVTLQQELSDPVLPTPTALTLTQQS